MKNKSLVKYMDFLLESKLNEKVSEDISEENLSTLKKLGFVIRNGAAYKDFISNGKVKRILVVESEGDENVVDVKLFGNKIKDSELIDKQEGIKFENAAKGLKKLISGIEKYIKAEEEFNDLWLMFAK